MKRLFVLITALIAVVHIGCSNFNQSVDELNPAMDPANPVIINIAAIAGVTPPAYGEIPTIVITETAQYTGSVTWSGSPATFEGITAYTASITLTAKTGYTLTGVAADFFTVAGATTDTNAADSGVITAVFPATGAVPPSVINISSIAGVTVPAADATPVTTITATSQYTGTVTWSGSPATFAGNTDYTATITLTAKTGYTLTGVAADFFTVAGATTDTNTADSGVITAVFPATTGVVIASNTWLSGVSGAWANARSVVVDSSGNRYITGSTSGALDGQTLNGTEGSDAFVMKYNSSGTKEWTRLFGTATKNATSNKIAVDTSGNIYVTGHINGDLNGQTGTGAQSLFVVKYNSAGTIQWTRLLGGAGSESATSWGLGVDSSANIYITGYITAGTIGGETSLGGTNTAYIIKYDTSGTRLWTKLIAATGAITRGMGIAVDASGNSYVTGYTDADTLFDSTTIISTNNVYIIKYATDGTRVWTRLSGASGINVAGYGIAIDSSGNSYTTGYSTGSFDSQTCTGTSDVFVIKYATDGTKQWTRLLGVAASSNSGADIAVDSSGSNYVTGYTNSTLGGQTRIGTRDAFVIKYAADGSYQFTKLVGVASVDTFGYGIALDSSGNSFVVGNTSGNLDGKVRTGSQDAFITTKFNY